jgi:hypothetical protein
MHFAGVLPEDAPDPRRGQAEKLKLMPVPLMGLVVQSSLEDVSMESVAYGQDATGYVEMAASISYTLWRNPDDRSDPINLAVLDEKTRRSLDEVPPWPRPVWLVEQVERMRYPLLWEAVRTTWHRDPSELSAPRRVLIDHANYVLMNRFREELGLGEISSDRFAARLTERAVNDRMSVRVDGVEKPAIEIDADPYVYAIGAEIGAGTVVTAVVPRDELDYVRIEFAQRSEPKR